MRFIILSVLVISLFSCYSKKKESENDDSADSKKKVTSRNYSISPQNSYDDIFLDSNIVEKFIAAKNFPDTVASRIRSFYNARNYEFAWFSSDGLSEQARGFWNLHNFYIKNFNDTSLEDKRLKKVMNDLITDEDLSPSPKDNTIIETELLLTRHFIHYTQIAYEKGYVKRKEMERFIPSRKLGAMYLADSFLTKKHKDNKYYEDVNESYRELKNQLKKYYDINKSGGWPAISTDQKKFKKGEAYPQIASIKKRLYLTGELQINDTSSVFNDTLETALKAYQVNNGLKADGSITPELIKTMNIPAIHRLQQILINMERMRWMPPKPEGSLIIINIPEFELHLYEGAKKAFDMKVVVGKEGHNTTIFTGNINQIVFNPYWNVPSSIVKKEILQEIKKHRNYLEKNDMEIIGHGEDGLPDIRQLPGNKNALGRIKFLFPNSFDIYLHDTPAKELFNRKKRAFSHGCIRLKDPLKLAEYILSDQPEWTVEKIKQTISTEKEKFVRVTNQVPVFITYYTAWVDENGVLNFREDIYNHDADLIRKMFTAAD